MNEKKLINTLPFGYAYCKTITDKESNVIDFIYIAANILFERIIGANDAIINKTEKELNVEFNFIKYIDKDVLNNEIIKVEYYLKEQSKWFKIQIELDEKDFFTITLFDITEYKKQIIPFHNNTADVNNISLTDIIEVDSLQKIQDAFVNATGVASVITNMNGEPITIPSNFSGVCKLIRETEKGRINCFNSDKLIGIQASNSDKPTYAKCLSCGFIDSGSPIIVNGKRLALWFIGQSNIGEVNSERIVNYALEIGANPEEMLAEYQKMPNMSIDKFENIANLSYLLSKELGKIAFSNLQFQKYIVQQQIYEDEIIKAKNIAIENEHKLSVKNDEYESVIEELNQTLEELFQAKNKAEESEIRLKALHDASFGGIAIHDKGIILDCNNGLSEMMGYTYKELIGMDGLLLIAEKSRDLVFNNIKTGNTKPYEAFGLRKNGEEFPMRLEAREIPFNGKKVRSVEFRDITVQKQTENDLLIAQKRLKEAMLMADLVKWEYDLEKDIFTFNDDFYKLYATNVTIENGYQMNALEYVNRFVYKDDIPMIALAMEDANNSNINDDGSIKKLEHRIIRRDNTVRDIVVSYFSIYDEKGKKIKRFGANQDITDYKRTKIQLQEKLEHLQLINENIPNILWKANIDEKYNFYNTFISETVDEFLGLPKNTINHSFPEYFKYVKPQYIPDIMNVFKSAVANPGKKFSFDYEVTKADGSIAWFLSMGNVTFKNNVIYAFGTTTDITEQKNTELILHQKNKDDAFLTELSFQLIDCQNKDIIKDIALPMLKKHTNAVYSQFAEFNIEKSTLVIKHIEADNTLLNLVVKVAGKKIFSIESPVNKDDYQTILQNELKISTSLHDLSFGAIPKIIDNSIKKITGLHTFYAIAHIDRNQIYGVTLLGFKKEQILPSNQMLNSFSNILAIVIRKKQTEQALIESEAKFKKIIDESTDGITICDNTGKIINCNKKIIEITEYEKTDFIGKNAWEFQSMLMNNLISSDSLKKPILHILKNYDTFENNKTSNIEIKTKLGKSKHLSSSSFFITYNDKKYLVQLIRDITEKIQNEGLLKKLEIAEATTEFKQRFLANMSHEMRTPMNGIIGVIEFLLKTPLNESQLDYVNTIKDSSETLLNLLNDILILSKIEAGKLTVNNTTFQSYELITKSEKLFSALIKQKHLQFTTTFDDGLPKFLKADFQKIIQIITNLISNAIKFTDKGRVELHIKLLTIYNQKDCLIEISVTDTGIGIPELNAEKIFDSFTQADNTNTRLHDGVGLGLTISKNLVDLLKGQINVISKVGVGTKFWFTFNAEVAHFSTVAPTSDIKFKRNKIALKVLLVEDKKVNQKVVELMLKNLHCEVEIAQNGKEAIDLLDLQFLNNAKFNYDLILMDISMPIMDGEQAVKYLRAKYNKLPIIIGLSANAMEGDKEYYISIGMDDYLSKPVKIEDLEDKINKWL